MFANTMFAHTMFTAKTNLPAIPWRLVRLALLACVALLLLTQCGLAADGNIWPEIKLDPDRFRGPGQFVGGYLSLAKILACWLLFLCWVDTTDWISQDVQILRLRVHVWNPIVVGTFALAFLLVWVIPAFWFGFLLMIVAYIAPLTTYILFRNARVEDHRKVLTPDHLRHWGIKKLRLFGIKIEPDQPAAGAAKPKQPGADVQFTARGGATPQVNEGLQLSARQLPAYLPAQQLAADALTNRAEAALLDFGGDGVAVRYMIDGCWHNSQPQTREDALALLDVYKTLAGQEGPTTTRMAGEFGLRYQGAVHDCRISAQATDGGSRVLLKFRSLAETGPRTLEELGMRPKMAEQLVQLVDAPHGLILFSGVPGGGLTTTLDVLLSTRDRFVRDFCTVEDVQRRERDITNLDVTTYDSAAGQSPASVLPKLLRAQPNVVVVRDLINADTVRLLSAEAAQRMVITSIAARDACEALLRVLMLKVPPQEFAAATTAVVHSRLLRRLCERCKEAYPPPPELLKQLGLPADKVTALYRPRQEQDAICEDCRGLGYRGRIGLYELLPMTPAIRAVLVKTPQVDALRKAAREAGVLSAREQGILLVARGLTSLEELQRILKT
ncbi:MAG: Flp pilus assembly complex ATPase component TadA [Planctomycetia bacterium]|nr:Flp pilus assembly complex ATPase component TadA [Planctomycetia bacterium]